MMEQRMKSRDRSSGRERPNPESASPSPRSRSAKPQPSKFRGWESKGPSRMGRGPETDRAPGRFGSRPGSFSRGPASRSSQGSGSRPSRARPSRGAADSNDDWQRHLREYLENRFGNRPSGMSSGPRGLSGSSGFGRPSPPNRENIQQRMEMMRQLQQKRRPPQMNGPSDSSRNRFQPARARSTEPSRKGPTENSGPRIEIRMDGDLQVIRFAGKKESVEKIKKLIEDLQQQESQKSESSPKKRGGQQRRQQKPRGE